MTTAKQKIAEAESLAKALFKAIEDRGLVVAGKSERDLNNEVFELAFELFGIEKYWHKRIVRAGRNTLLPYKDNPPDLVLQTDDIVFFDFGPVFEEWEADIGKTYVLGTDAIKLKLKEDVERAWWEGKQYYDLHSAHITGAEFYEYTKGLATKYGWEYGNAHCGHLIGEFPHERIVGEDTINYIHPQNTFPMSNTDSHGNERLWIYEIHFIDRHLEIGGFFEQLLS
ncbi:MAG: M24 family metallopeptidase [Candidatus Kapabacteria bacterium]|nr:M24 family metallopeptidase [Candidatus Kapabacteria bacterium]